MWLLSRIVIAIAMLGIAPLLPAPPGGIQPEIGWDVFAAWDSDFYEMIATSGYNYVDDGKGYNVAFFPLFPLLIRLAMIGGLPFNIAGTIINNLAFWGALVILYSWVQKTHGYKVAHWTIAVLAWCPFSLFGTVIYTEGLFLLLSTAALKAYDQRQYIWAGLWGALASATRPPGIVLSPVFLLIAWQQRRSAIAYFSGITTIGGIGIYSLYCKIRFNDFLAFFKVQQAWQPEQAYYGQSWVKMLAQILVGNANWEKGFLYDPWHPILFITICVVFYWLLKSQRIKKYPRDCGLYLLWILLWLLVGDPLINMIMVLGGYYLLIQQRKQLKQINIAYGFYSLILITTPGRTISIERHVYGIVSLAIALGNLLAQHPKWGRLALLFSGIMLAIFSIRFSQHLWVA